MGVVLDAMGSFAESVCSTARLLRNEQESITIVSVERAYYEAEWTLQCMNCGHYAPNIPGVVYCPNCGRNTLTFQN